jgi:hypothetical protein
MIVKIELRDKSFNILENFDAEFMNLTWEYNRIGGCGSFSFDLPRQYCNEKFISGDFNVRIYVRNATTKIYDLWFQGIVENKAPNVRGIDETISVQGHGYQAQLSRIQLSNVTYTGQEISVIVKNILDNYIVPNTDIIYTGSDIVATGFTPDSITFNTDALNAIQTLADITGTREWGVNSSRSLFFKSRSSSSGIYFPLGDKLTGFSSDDSFKDIVNRVIIQGGDVAGVPFTPDPTSSPYNDTPSQNKYGRHDLVYSNSSITTDSVAQQFATSVLLEKKDVVRRGRCELSNYETQIESTIPIPLFELIARGTLYGEKAYGIFLYSGRIQYQVNRITYKLSSNDSSLVTNMEFGQPRPNVSESIAQLAYQLEQLRSAGL